jgi:hypothetical protein
MVNAIGVFFFLHKSSNDWPDFQSNRAMRGAVFYRLSECGLPGEKLGLAFVRDTASKAGRFRKSE